MKQQPLVQMFKMRQTAGTVSAYVLTLTLSFGTNAQEQAPPQIPAAQQRLTTPNNQSSQRYEVNQTFARSAYFKDNNVWVYDKEFADVFGMPAQYIEGVQGIVAAAFRIEDASYQECSWEVETANTRASSYRTKALSEMASNDVFWRVVA